MEVQDMGWREEDEIFQDLEAIDPEAAEARHKRLLEQQRRQAEKDEYQADMRRTYSEWSLSRLEEEWATLHDRISPMDEGKAENNVDALWQQEILSVVLEERRRQESQTAEQAA